MEEKRKPRGKSLRAKVVRGLSVLVILVVGVAVVQSSGNPRAKLNARRSSCQTNLKQIMLSVRQYAQDYDEKYPLVKVDSRANFDKAAQFSAFGWADALWPYLRSSRILQCPSEATFPANYGTPQFQTEGVQNQKAVALPPDRTPLQPQYTDYWFNARASGAGEKQVQEPAQTIFLGDGNDGTDLTDARYHLPSIPLEWRQNKESPLHRHLEGANYAFADGHVKWFNASKWKSELDMQNGPTLRLQPVK